MKHLKDLKTPTNQAANGLRLTGTLLMTVGAVALIADSANTHAGLDFYKQAKLHLVVVGAVVGSIGEGLWKMLIRNSDVTKRQFYFQDEE